jgi:GNAT superfamily N-acetyltransferase
MSRRPAGPEVSDAGREHLDPVTEATIRPRRRADEDACVTLLRQVHERDRYPLIWPAHPGGWLYRSARAWVAERAGVVCGHVALTRPHPGAAATAWADHLSVPASGLICVSLLFVGPQARGGGVGGSLLDTALGEIRAMGAAAVLEVVSLNGAAVALYEARGWRQIGSIRYDWLPEQAQCVLYVAPRS